MTDAAARQQPSTRPRRRHVAAGSRIAALGLGTATMFGIVGALALAQQSTAADTTPAPAPTAVAPRVVVVVHRADGSTVQTAGTGSPAIGAAPQPAGSGATTPATPGPPAAQGTPVVIPAAPVVLTAQPTVVPAPAAATPAASTHGSR